MDMRIIEVPYDGRRWYSSRWTALISIRADALASVASVDEMLPAWGIGAVGDG